MAKAKKIGELAWFWGLLAALLFCLAGAWLLFGVLLPLFVALGLAYAVNPLVDAIERRGLPRAWSIALMMLALTAAAAGVLAFILPSLYDEVLSFSASLPDLLSAGLIRAAAFADAQGFDFPVGKELTDMVHSSLGQLAPGAYLAKQLFSGAGSVLITVLNLVVLPFFFFFILRDLPRIKHYVFGLIPLRHHALVAAEFAKIDRVLAGYLRGQLIVALILSVVYATSLTLIGVKFGLFIGILAGFLNIIPYVGQATGLVLALLMGAAEFNGWSQFLAIPALFVAVHLVENNILSPRVVGGAVGLSSIQAILALLVGAHLGGIPGMVVAVPMAGSLKVLLLDLIGAYQKSDYYLKKTAGKA